MVTNQAGAHDGCKNCPENNPAASRVALRIDLLERWQGDHDERYEEREKQRKRDQRSVILSVAAAIIIMLITSAYNTFITKVGSNAENNTSRMQKYSDQNTEYNTRGRGHTVHDSNNPEVRDGVK